jgi:hypothetical protein
MGSSRVSLLIGTICRSSQGEGCVALTASSGTGVDVGGGMYGASRVPAGVGGLYGGGGGGACSFAAAGGGAGGAVV